jgi:hypothetical protein
MVTHWEGEDVILTFEPADIMAGSVGAVYNYEGKITSFRKSGGSQTLEERYAFGNKTFALQKPREKFTVEFEYITKDPTFAHMHFGHATLGTAGTAVIRSDATPKNWRITAWFIEKAGQKKSGTVTVPLKTGYECYRIVFIDCKAVTNDSEFAADDMFKGTISFELTATDTNGYPNMIEQYAATAGGLETFNTTAYRGLLTWSTTATTWSGGTAATRYRVG